MSERWIAIAIIASLLFIPVVEGSDWSADNHDLQNTSSTPDNGPEPPLKFLWNPKKLYIGGDWLTPIVHHNTVYLIRSYRNVADPWFLYPFDIWAVNITTGEVLWINNGTNWNGATYAFYKSGVLYIDAPGIIEAINSSTGKVIWKKSLNAFTANFVIYRNKMYYFVHNFNNESSWIMCINIQNGNTLTKIPVRANISGTRWQPILIWNDIVYIHNGYNKTIAVSLRNGTLIWEYEVKNPYYDFVNSPMIMGDGMIYAPFATMEGGEIVALNATTGKVMWSRITDPLYDDFQYKFAYSAKYHMVVRLNGTGYLIAMDSRNGHILWTTNTSMDDYAPSLSGNVVIANNHIYFYRIMWKNPNDVQRERQVGVLQIYNITDGEMIYYMQLPTQATTTGCTSLDLPDIAVSNGKVIIPDNYLYIIVHYNAYTVKYSSALAYIGTSAAVIGVVIGTIFIARRKK